jgi:hypothetical protein
MTGPLTRRRLRKRAGASAVREYEKLKKQWRADRRGFFWGAGAFTFAFVAVTALVGIHHLWVYSGGMLSGAVLMAFLLLRESPPPWIENWQVGAWGEQRTARAIEPLLSRGWVIVHDLDRFKFNLDHVLIGPGGVYVLDTKNFPGMAEAKGDDLQITRPDGRAGHHGADLARNARGQGSELNRILRQRCGVKAWVNAVVVLWAEFPAKVVAADRMSYVHGGHLVEWLEAQPARLNSNQIAQIAAALAPGQRRRVPSRSEAPAQP